MSGKEAKDKFGFLRLPESGMTTFAPHETKGKYGYLSFRISRKDLESMNCVDTFLNFAAGADDHVGIG